MALTGRCCEGAEGVRPPEEKALARMRAALALAFSGGTPAGVCAVGLEQGEAALVRFLGVVPARRRQGIGRALEAHAVETARRRGFGEIRTPAVDSRNRAGTAFLEGLGWTPRPEASLRMWRNLEDLPAVTLPEGYAIRTFREGDEAHLMRVKNAAFAGERTGSRPWTPEDVRREYDMDSPGFRPERVFFAVCGDEPVGMTTAWTYTHEGREVGLIHWVAVTPAHRGKGLGEALNVQALHCMRTMGRREAVLNTNAVLQSAVRLYLRLGFREAWRQVVYFRKV
jgi:mycothiol synthase